MARVDRGSRHWVQLIRLARPAFVTMERLEDYRTIVIELAAELTDPKVASEVFRNILDRWRDKHYSRVVWSRLKGLESVNSQWGLIWRRNNFTSRFGRITV